MAIDITEETLIPLNDVPNYLPKGPSGKKIHIATIYRWIRGGIKGGRLEAVRIGGRTYTSVEALQRFARQEPEPHPPRPAFDISRLPKWRQRQIEAAEQICDEFLGTDKKSKTKRKRKE